MSRSVNLAIIVGNLTRDPEMRYTPQGHAVTSFGVATNRRWLSEGEEREDVEFHNVVAWNKLAEICNELLRKGRKVYIQGRLQTRSWEGAGNIKRTKTEIVADDMIVLGSKYPPAATGARGGVTPAPTAAAGEEEEKDPPAAAKSESSEEVEASEIPF